MERQPGSWIETPTGLVPNPDDATTMARQPDQAVPVQTTAEVNDNDNE